MHAKILIYLMMMLFDLCCCHLPIARIENQLLFIRSRTKENPFRTFPRLFLCRKFAEYRTNDGGYISLGRHAQPEDTAEFGKLGHARVSVFDTEQISNRFHTAIGIDCVRSFGETIGTRTESGRTRDSRLLVDRIAHGNSFACPCTWL